MNLMLDLPELSYTKKIHYTDRILMIGSCFSEEIGNRMRELKFDVLQNPNGILYDPLSVSRSIISYVDNKNYNADDLFYRDELWHSWQHHSSFSGMDKAAVINKINRSQNKANEFISNADWLIITFGSSFYYELQNGEAVANCHKLPAPDFTKKLLQIGENVAAITNCIQRVKDINPGIKIILTVSPVRYTRDGIVENNRSKARLIEATHTLAEKIENAFYFPAYEIVIDVLRDHRFYKEDLVHPSAAAIDYVFDVFVRSVLEKQDQVISGEIKKLTEAKNHRVFNSETNAHTQFRKANFLKANSLQVLYPYLDLSEEIKYFGD